MWLIDSHSYNLVPVVNAEDYEYAILSHTWALPDSDDQEVLFQDMADLKMARQKTYGWSKIEMTCTLARERRLEYAWVDTCCIDKSSSAELSEAINSMFRWYELSTVCFAYLVDLLPQDSTFSDIDVAVGRLQGCQWFKRGWTLQELIAPSIIEFYDQGWNKFGDKAGLCKQLKEITGIDGAALQNKTDLQRYPVAVRMSWAVNRKTTRVEDIAYCLLGIFDINMPMLYGEGHKAFFRLQQAIAQETNDLSLFAWQQSEKVPTNQRYRGIFAKSPNEFANCSKILKHPQVYHEVEFSMTNRGLNIQTCLGYGPHDDYILNLDCFELWDDGSIRYIGIHLEMTPNGFVRYLPTNLYRMCSLDIFDEYSTSCYIRKVVSPDDSLQIVRQHDQAFRVNYDFPQSVEVSDGNIAFLEFNHIDRGPSRSWDPNKYLHITNGIPFPVGFDRFSVHTSYLGREYPAEFVVLFGILKNVQDDFADPWISIHSHLDSDYWIIQQFLGQRVQREVSSVDLVRMAHQLIPSLQSAKKQPDLALRSESDIKGWSSMIQGGERFAVSVSCKQVQERECNIFTATIRGELVKLPAEPDFRSVWERITQLLE
ncbi:related to beta transducin-like protein [Phialocephala subalpina]|uniref:Related to beta transducin-like protein n=1 Tax=Phialocephala subalpina TaxID=576137 RepID=A0A1L7WI40_9HELO|nr:related to beta transducin-like protein [Phialocephala subalpina]